MNRKPTKRWQVETWLHRQSGTTLEIYYDRNVQEFWSIVATERVSAKTQVEVKAMASELADKLLVSEDKWRRIILVSTSGRDGEQTRYGGFRPDDAHDSPEVGFHMKRAWVMDADDGKRMTRRWDRNRRNMHDDRLEAGNDIDRFYDYSHGEEVVEIPYSDELWERLLAFSKYIGAARARLTELLQTPERLSYASVLQLQIGAGGKRVENDE
jgi:hypothetical protein